VRRLCGPLVQPAALRALLGLVSRSDKASGVLNVSRRLLPLRTQPRQSPTCLALDGPPVRLDLGTPSNVPPETSEMLPSASDSDQMRYLAGVVLSHDPVPRRSEGGELEVPGLLRIAEDPLPGECSEDAFCADPARSIRGRHEKVEWTPCRPRRIKRIAVDLCPC